MPDYKKIYTVTITYQENGSTLWYARKYGKVFECELSNRSTGRPAFKVLNSYHFINPDHCKVLSERQEY